MAQKALGLKQEKKLLGTHLKASSSGYAQEYVWEKETQKKDLLKWQWEEELVSGLGWTLVQLLYMLAQLEEFQLDYLLVSQSEFCDFHYQRRKVKALRIH